jgi:hypothetical protein
MDMQMDSDSSSMPPSPKKDMKLAFDIQSRNKKKKMMAQGGTVNAKTESRPSTQEDKPSIPMGSPSGPEFADETRASIDFKPTKDEMDMLRTRRIKMAEGGWVDGYDMSADDQDHDRDLNMDSGPNSHAQEIDANSEDERPASIVAAIMSKRKKFADGGMVDLDENAKEDKNNLDDDNYGALKKENYSEKSGLDDLDEPSDSNEQGDDLEDEDSHDMISSIRSKMNKKMR